MGDFISEKEVNLDEMGKIDPISEKDLIRGNFCAHLGKRIKALRIQAGMTQSALANVMRVSYQQVQKYESGADQLSAWRLSQLAWYFCVPESFFYENINKETILASLPANKTAKVLGLNSKESRKMIEAFCNMSVEQRQKIYQLLKVMAGE